jgi:small subunit ribosomal protein S17
MADEEKNETTEEMVQEPEASEEPVAEAETPDEPTAEEPAAEEEEEAPEPAPEAEAPDEPVAEAEADEPAAETEAAQPAAEAPADEAAAEAAAADVAVEAPGPAAKKKRKHVPRSERRQRPKPVRASEGRKPRTREAKPEHERGQRQERRGVVVSSAMDKTIVVRVETLKAHRRYKKIIRRSAKFHAHDERNEANVGDLVRIVETRPLSKTKRWRLAEVVEAAK